MKSNHLTRRRFIRRAGQVAGAVATFTIVPRHVLGGDGYTAPSNTLTKGLIGFGGIARSGNHLGLTASDLLAVCDPDQRRMEEGMKMGEERYGHKVDGYRDFRELLDREDIDIAHICTPPHWHGLMSIAAAQAGKDIWCEKPMTRTIGEGKKVVQAVQANGRMFRLNTWFRFEGGYYGFGTPVAPLRKLVHSGLLGWPLTATVNASTGFDWKFNWSGRLNLTPEPVPEHFDYDMWLGPAPMKPYHPHRTHDTFRGYWDYDGGGLGDMGQHYLDPVQMLLGKDDTSPIEIDVDCPPQHPDAVSSWRRIEMRYADGCKIILDGENKDTEAPFLEGPRGKVWPRMESSIPNLMERLADFPDPEPQQIDFLDSVRTRKKFALNEEIAHRSCTIVNLGTTAVRLGRGFRFDPVNQVAIDDELANRYIDQPMRAPWSL